MNALRERSSCTSTLDTGLLPLGLLHVRRVAHAHDAAVERRDGTIQSVGQNLRGIVISDSLDNLAMSATFLWNRLVR